MDELDIILAFGPFRLSLRRQQLIEGDRPVPLGARAFAILQHLVTSAGRTVGKAELTAAVWGRQAVEDNNLTVQISALRRALGEGRGAARYLLTVPGAGYRFIAPVDRLKPDSETSLGNLPRATTPFIGRTSEIEGISRLLSEASLVTISGVGGIGKTRLAIQVAAAANYADGTWLVDLVGAVGVIAVSEAVGSVLGLGGISSAGVEAQLLGHLKTRRLLLVLDNCEHTTEAVAHVAAAILRECPGVVILATSRERLGAAGERLFRLRPLPFPAADDATPTQALAYDAVRLFIDRATAVVEGFAADASNIPTIVRICARLDGIALAIEMAAPRLRILTLAQVEQRLNERFRLLVAPDRNAVPRQRTLRSMIDWSYELLEDHERHLLQCLSVFAGGATLATVAAIAGGDDLAVVDSLTALVEKSLVVADRREHEPRFRLLETIRDYAAEKLADAGSTTACQRRHAVCYADIFERAEARWAESATARWIEQVGPEVDNLRAALEWAFGADGDVDIGQRLAAASYPLWWDLPQMPLREGLRWLERAQATLAPDTPDAIAGRVLLGLSWRDMRNNDTAGIAAATQAVERFRWNGDRLLLGAALWRLITTRFHAVAAVEMQAMIAEAEAALRPLGRSKWLALLLIKRADVDLFAGHLDAALAGYGEASAMANALGYWYAQIVCTTNLSELLFDLGRRDEAIAQLAGMREQLPPSRRAPLLAPLAGHLLLADRDEEMRAVIRETIECARMVGFTAAQGWVAEALALNLAREGLVDEAARLAGHARAIHPMAAARVGARRAIYRYLEEILAIALPADRRENLQAEGCAWAVQQAADEILRHSGPRPEDLAGRP